MKKTRVILVNLIAIGYLAITDYIDRPIHAYRIAGDIFLLVLLNIAASLSDTKSAAK